MAQQTPTGEPSTATAGDTWQWIKQLRDYAPTETGGTWTLSYAIAGAGALTWDASWVTSDGARWTVTIPASATAGLPSGGYRWTAIVTGGSGYAGQRWSPETGVVTVVANPALLAAGDVAPWAETQLTVVEAVLAGRITADIQAYTIGGRAVTSIPLAELYALRTKLQHEVYRLRNPGTAGPVRLLRFTGTR